MCSSLTVFVSNKQLLFYGAVPVFTWDPWRPVGGTPDPFVCIHVCIYPLLTSCVSLGGPGPMHSFSEWEKLLRTRYTTQSVVCVMIWQLASIHRSPHGMPLSIGHMLTPAMQTASHQQRVQPDSCFLAGIILARILMEFSIIEWVSLLNSSILVTIRLSHSSSSQYWHHNLRSKDHLHRGSAEGLLEAAPDGDWTTNPQFWAVIHNHLHRGLNYQHIRLSDQFKHEYCI